MMNAIVSISKQCRACICNLKQPVRWYINGPNYTQRGKRIAFTEEDCKKLVKQKPRSPRNSRLLKVAIIGAPNAGKSTLANRMLGWRFSAVSSKVNTTRSKTRGVLTQDEVQIVFLDTPGMINQSWMKWRDMERTLLTDPHASLYEADVIAVVLDIEPVWSRRRLNKDIVKALALHRDKRSILILNKVDQLKSKLSLFDIVNNLTGGVVGGRERKRADMDCGHKELDRDGLFTRMEKIHKAKSKLAESQKADSGVVESSEQSPNKLSMVEKHVVSEDIGSGDEGEMYTVDIEEYGEGGQLVDLSKEEVWTQYEKRLQDTQLDDPTRWKEFEKVFIVSAKTGSGVQDVVDWFMKNAYPSPWCCHGDVVTDQEPVTIARMAVWEKMLDHLPREIPYVIKIVLDHWYIDETGQLRIHFFLYCNSNDAQSKLLGRNGDTIKTIQRKAKEDLMNTFKTDLHLELTARLHRGQGLEKSKNKNKTKHRKVISVEPKDCEIKAMPEDCEVKL